MMNEDMEAMHKAWTDWYAKNTPHNSEVLFACFRDAWEAAYKCYGGRIRRLEEEVNWLDQGYKR
jgi:hypothetical protein